MLTSNMTAYHTFWQLLVSNFRTFKSRLFDQIINALTWGCINIAVFAYIMPARGLTDYGSFIFITIMTVQGFFIPVHNIILLVSDINDQGSNLYYELTLPIPQSWIFIKYAVANAYQGLLSTLFILPAGKLLLWNSFSFQHFSIFKFYLVLILLCLFSGFFSLFLASRITSLFKIANMWQRVIFPMWFLAGFQFSWQNLYKISPVMAYLSLLNPLTYALEGGRAAALDPALSLPYWYCTAALAVCTIVFGYLGIARLKKRLDCL